MAHKIQIKRGNKADLPTLDDGEFGLCQDTAELFIGNSGNVKVFPTMPEQISADIVIDGVTNKVYTATEKTKLAGIANNANNYSHPTSDGSKHVPANGTANNGKVLKAGATAGTYVWSDDNDTITTINGKTGAISKADITALGIPAQDTVYTHPTNHPPSIILQDTNNRFVSDSEKGVWNGKQDALGFTPVNTTDSRLSDARTPLTHTHAESEITNLVTDLAGKEPVISTKNTAFNKNYNTSTANIKMDGTVAVGTQDSIARADHVHPKDTSKAPLASPTFTGTPKAPTATAGTNTTQIATTAFVTSAVSSAGGNVTYLSATAPTSPKTGDTWYQIL